MYIFRYGPEDFEFDYSSEVSDDGVLQMVTAPEAEASAKVSSVQMLAEEFENCIYFFADLVV